MNRRIFYNVFVYLIIIVFALSVYFKLYSYIEFVSFVSETLSTNEKLSLIISNIIIGLELFILFMFITNQNSSFVYYSLLTILSTFCIFSLLLIFQKNVDNCHCFGTFLKLTPMETLLKNGFLIASLVLLRNEFKNKKNENSITFQVILLILTCVSLQFTINNPMNFFRTVQLETIEISEFKKLSNYKLIDARTKQQHLSGHIPGSLNIPIVKYNTLDLVKKIRTEVDALALSTVIVTYCDNSNCGLAYNLAYEIKNIYPDRKVYYLKGGVETWIKHNHKH